MDQGAHPPARRRAPQRGCRDRRRGPLHVAGERGGEHGSGTSPRRSTIATCTSSPGAEHRTSYAPLTAKNGETHSSFATVARPEASGCRRYECRSPRVLWTSATMHAGVPSARSHQKTVSGLKACPSDRGSRACGSGRRRGRSRATRGRPRRCRGCSRRGRRGGRGRRSGGGDGASAAPTACCRGRRATSRAGT